MKETCHLPQRGAVLVFALLIVVVAATVLGGIVQLAATQTLAGQGEWAAAARRIRLDNSRALARQYVLAHMWKSFGELSPATLASSATGGAGGFSISGVDPASGYWLSLKQDDASRINPFNLFERGGFQSAWATATLSSGSGNIPWGFQVRTRSPIVAGFSFVNQLPASNSWQPTRRMDMNFANYATGFPALPRMPVSSITNRSLSAAAVRFTDMVALEVPKAEADFGDLLQTQSGVATNAVDPLNPVAAQVELNLGTFGYYVVPGGSSSHFYQVPAMVDVVVGGAGTNSTNYNVPVTRLILSGGGSASSIPAQVVIPETCTALTNVTLAGGNSRMVYLYRRGAASPGLVISTAGGNTEFRIGMTLDCPADLRVSGSLTIVGGIRTGSLLTQSTGNTLVLQSEDNPTWKYDAIADRMMWLEDQRMR